MRAVVCDFRPAGLARRRAIGIDRWDEVWDGVLHIPPNPTVEHQRILVELVVFILPLMKRAARGTFVSQLVVVADLDEPEIQIEI